MRVSICIGAALLLMAGCGGKADRAEREQPAASPSDQVDVGRPSDPVMDGADEGDAGAEPSVSADPARLPPIMAADDSGAESPASPVTSTFPETLSPAGDRLPVAPQLAPTPRDRPRASSATGMLPMSVAPESAAPGGSPAGSASSFPRIAMDSGGSASAAPAVAPATGLAPETGTASVPNPPADTPPATASPQSPGPPADPAGNAPAEEVRPESDKYEVVQVYYATDRKAEEKTASLTSFLLPLGACSLALGMYGASLLCAVGRRIWLVRLGHVGMLATFVLCGNLALQWYRQGELKGQPRLAYGNGRGPLELGVCKVTIPKTHQVGAVESPSLLRLEVRQDQAKHVVLESVEQLQKDRFYERLRTAVASAARPEVFVFVHGYNVTFDSAARRTGQLAYDLEYEGTALMYSWPSQGGLLQYTIDETNVVWTVPHLKEFLLDVSQHSGATAVNLVAHSMGNRALTAALRELHLELRDEARLFNKVVLAAPDVDAEVFRQIAPAVVQTANHVTLYASSSDQALVASKKVHGYSRAGESGEHLVVTPGVDTIDVSSIDTSLLGHSYYGSSHWIIKDLYNVMTLSLPAAERRWLQPRSRDGLTYWLFQELRVAEQ